MDFYAVIETSAFIWDTAILLQDSRPYRILAENLVNFMEVFDREKPQILLRRNLLYEMMAGFPCEMAHGLPNFSDLSNAIYRFLSFIGYEMIEFSGNILHGIYSNPNIV